MATLVLISYFSILGILCVFGWHRLYITYLFRKYARSAPKPKEKFQRLPRITVQLPVFNERFVIERLIDATAAIDYPKDRLDIQVLDDSTDETRELAQKRVTHYQNAGIDIAYIHRHDRTGYKAGALAHGLKTAEGEFIAIFDADFVPDKNFLHDSIHHFTDPQIAMVQARWEHLNRSYSLLTQIQAILLDAHFLIEHGGRCYSNRFFNFNGTAGLWRVKAIEDAGGWTHDTLTEDMDLSYRTQLKGWRFLFLPDLTCPAELPTEMVAFKTQQHRWAKGATQVLIKLLPTIWKAHIPLRVKIEATFHLAGNIAFVLMTINSIFFLIPSMFFRQGWDWRFIILFDGPLFFLASISFIHFYLSSQRVLFHSIKGHKRFIPCLMALGIGLGINNSRAVIEAFLGKSSAFIRTPKLGSAAIDKSAKRSHKTQTAYVPVGAKWGLFELALGLMYTTAVGWAVWVGMWASIPFLMLFQNGFLFVGLTTLREQFKQQKVAS